MIIHSPLPGATTAPTDTPNFNVINAANENIIVLGGGDNNRRQRFCNNINDMMHLLGHLFHNLSDLHINIRDRPPRQIHTMSSMQQTASAIISARPIETNITLRSPNAGAADLLQQLQHGIQSQARAGSADPSATAASATRDG